MHLDVTNEELTALILKTDVEGDGELDADEFAQVRPPLMGLLFAFNSPLHLLGFCSP